MKLTKTGIKKYETKVGDITYKITPNNYSYYLQYDLVAIDKESNYIDYSREFMPNLNTVREFIKKIS